MKLVALVLSLLAAAPLSADTASRKPLIQLAILLDTSNSMDGLIDQARKQLWHVVNELATAKKGGASPELQVALYEYGNDRLPAKDLWVRRVLPLTTDLDRVSEELFGLRTNGGQEYCGAVIDEATKELEWSRSNNDMKLIFIAGNEPFTQGQVDFHGSCKKAIARGIVVNTVFCGPRQEGIETQWKAGADLADGRYMSIDQNSVAVDIPAPQDKEIAELGSQLNTTYITYGASGAAGAGRQQAQDANLKAAPTANIARQVAKASAMYSNEMWDLVDATSKGKVDVEKMDAKDLPPEMKKMTPAQRKAYVAEAAKKRGEIQAKIKKLDQDRKKFIAEKMRQQAAPKGTLDEVVITTVRDQGSKQGYKFPQ